MRTEPEYHALMQSLRPVRRAMLQRGARQAALLLVLPMGSALRARGPPVFRTSAACVSASSTDKNNAAAVSLVGGEWAGWHNTHDGDSGALRKVPERYCSDALIEWDQVPAGFQVLVTEVSRGGGLDRTSARVLPEDGCLLDAGCLLELERSTGLPEPQPAGSAPSGESHCWACDAAATDEVGSRLWSLETIFEGVGGVARPRARRDADARGLLAERTRVCIIFDVATGSVRGDALVAAERRWSARPSAEHKARLKPRGPSRRSAVDAQWLWSAVGVENFGELPVRREPVSRAPPQLGSAAPAVSLQLAGGVTVRGWPGRLDVEMQHAPPADPSASPSPQSAGEAGRADEAAAGERRVSRVRRSWLRRQDGAWAGKPTLSLECF